MAKKKEEITIRSSTAEYLTYIASVGDVETSFEMRYEDENIWLTQKLMAVLYDVDVRTVNYHIKKIFADSELQEDSVIRKFRITADDGKTYNANHYSLEMIIAVGFKVNSERAVQFRKWVNQIAKDYTIKGWVMDVERIKRGTYLTEKYFDGLGATMEGLKAAYEQQAAEARKEILGGDQMANLAKTELFQNVTDNAHYGADSSEQGTAIQLAEHLIAAIEADTRDSDYIDRFVTKLSTGKLDWMESLGIDVQLLTDKLSDIQAKYVDNTEQEQADRCRHL